MIKRFLELLDRAKEAVWCLRMRDKIVLGVLMGCIAGMFITITFGGSHPYMLWLKGGSSAYEKGDYVVLKYDKKDEFINDKSAIKQITCVSGERILRVEDSIYCGERYLGRVLKGEEYPQIDFNSVIPEGFYFVQGTNERSYDSRYFGIVPSTMFVRKLHPVAVFFEG